MTHKKIIKPYIYHKESKRGISIPEELTFNGENILAPRYFGMDFKKEHYIIDTTNPVEKIFERKLIVPTKLYKLENYCKTNLTAITDEIVEEKELFYNFSESILEEKKKIDKTFEEFSKKLENILADFKKDENINSQYSNYNLNKEDEWWRLN